MYRGSGMYLLCQLPLVSKYSSEPMAREMLLRVLDYAAGAETYHRPVEALRTVVKFDSDVDRRLRDVGIKCEPLAPDAAIGGSSVLIDASLGATEAQRRSGPAALPRAQGWSWSTPPLPTPPG